MRYTEKQLDEIVDRVSSISMAVKVIECELRNKNYAADKDYTFVKALDLIVSEAIKLKIDTE